MSDSLTHVGERLLILVRMCKCLFFTVRWDVFKNKEGGECLQHSGGYLYKVHR